MRRNRDPGTRNPFNCPLSKQRMIVCWLTLQTLAASPVVNTVFIWTSTPEPDSVRLARDRSGRRLAESRRGPESSMIGRRDHLVGDQILQSHAAWAPTL